MSEATPQMCAVHPGSEITSHVMGAGFCAQCIAGVVEACERWEAEKKASTDDPHACRTIGCAATPTHEYRFRQVARLAGLCITCQRIEQAVIASEREATRQRARRVKERERYAERVAWQASRWLLALRPCNQCGAKGAGSQDHEPSCSACVATNLAKWRRDRAYAANAKRRALKRNAAHAPYSRAEIFTRWDNTCAYCDAPAEHLDHVVALSRGGADAAHNLLPACAPCNLSKGARSLAEWVQSWGRSPDPL